MHNQNKNLSCITHASKLDKAYHSTHASMQKNVKERKGSFDHEKKTCKDMEEEKNSQDRKEMDRGAVGEPEWGLGEQEWSLGDLPYARRVWFFWLRFAGLPPGPSNPHFCLSLSPFKGPASICFKGKGREDKASGFDVVFR